MRWLVVISIIVIWMWNLSHQNSNFHPNIGYYFWTTKCKIPKDFKYTPYVKILDVSYQNKLSIIKTECSCTKKIVPVVYIDNFALKKISLNHLEKIIKSELKKYKFKKIQFDCDWTNKTRAKYFRLLNYFKNYNTEATIRLHQVKYFKQTGVPPVKKGILMFYNMSDFENPDTKNYILNLYVAKKYMTNFDKYPLKLDIALPHYSQATIIRYGEVVGLVEGIKAKDLDKTFVHISQNRYKVLITHYFKGHLFYKDDIVRVDEVTPIMIKKSIKLLKKHIRNRIENIVYFRYSN